MNFFGSAKGEKDKSDSQKGTALVSENEKLLAEFQMLAQSLQQGIAEEDSQGVTNQTWLDRIRKEGSGR